MKKVYLFLSFAINGTLNKNCIQRKSKTSGILSNKIFAFSVPTFLSLVDFRPVWEENLNFQELWLRNLTAAKRECLIRETRVTSILTRKEDLHLKKFLMGMPLVYFQISLLLSVAERRWKNWRGAHDQSNSLVKNVNKITSKL